MYATQQMRARSMLCLLAECMRGYLDATIGKEQMSSHDLCILAVTDHGIGYVDIYGPGPRTV